MHFVAWQLRTTEKLGSGRAFRVLGERSDRAAITTQHFARVSGVPAMDRFWDKVNRGAPDECWLWTGATTGAVGTRTRATGSFLFGGRAISAHRAAYQLEVGPIPEGLTIDHLCGTPLCVNPAHLEAVSQAVNIRRGKDFPEDGQHCKRGHRLVGENLYVWRGVRRCRACRRAWKRNQSKRPEVTP